MTDRKIVYECPDCDHVEYEGDPPFHGCPVEKARVSDTGRKLDEILKLLREIRGEMPIKPGPWMGPP